MCISSPSRDGRSRTCFARDEASPVLHVVRNGGTFITKATGLAAKRIRDTRNTSEYRDEATAMTTDYHINRRRDYV